ncbi:MAG: aminotransferase class III-fold pyridoxal phosphate-dependent enzyme [Actinomycetota bacterium]|nr:aminotransferase class III-fold pyridoxal phosphate-dependent enzyme [Actinomycetota bacterium]
MNDPLLAPRPNVSPELAAALLAEVYGIVGSLTELHGERDLNFRVDAADGRRYVLKVHHPDDSGDVVDMRTLAMAHVKRVDPTLPVAEVLRTPTGASRASIAGADGRISDVQVVTFLEGSHPDTAKLGTAALFEWGRCTARLGRALRGFFHPAAGYRIQWDVRHTSSLRDRLDLLTPEARKVVEPAIERFDAHVASRFESLRAQVIHNDMNPQNILVDDQDRIVGITDFGDMTHTALVCDLAVALAEVLVARDDGLDMAAPMIAGYSKETPLEDDEAAVLFDLLAARAATDVVVTTWRRLHHPHAEELPDLSLAFLRWIEAEGAAELAARVAAIARRESGIISQPLPYAPRPDDALRRARRKVLGPLELVYDEPLHIVWGEGAYLFDAAGRRYLDAYNNVPVAGHSHPAIAAAIAAQSRILVTNTRYLHEASVELAEQLLARAPGGVARPADGVERGPGRLERVLFVNSGSEANDVAWRIARFATGHDGALVTRFAYHGVTEATTALSPEEWPEGFAPEHVGLLPPPGTVGGDGGGASGAGAHTDMASGAGAHMGAASGTVEKLVAAGHEPAALFVDGAFTSDGIWGPANEWLAEAVAATRAAGGLFVADEVQAGYGRTGESLWSVTSSGIQPDFVTLGKPMGNGFPVAALLGRADLVDPFVEATGYFSTFGGNTLACAAALAVLRVVEEERLVEHAATSGAHLRRLVDEVAARHDTAGAVRSWGLLLGLEIVGADGAADPRKARQVVNRMRERGVLVGTTGPASNVLKIRPPLVFSKADGEELATRLDEALAALA